MRCYYQGTSNRGNEKWGNEYKYWTTSGVEDAIVQMCRRVFNGKYKAYWIDPIYFDDKYFRYTEQSFAEVGIELYPRYTDLQKELRRRGIDTKNIDKNRHSEIVWEIVHEDIRKAKNNGVKPVRIVVHTIRKPEFKEDYEILKSIRELKELDEANIFFGGETEIDY
jgi:hypothetical protein